MMKIRLLLLAITVGGMSSTDKQSEQPNYYHRLAERSVRTPAAAPSEQKSINDTLTLISQGESEISMLEGHRDVVLMVGLTGAGKTTLTKFMVEPEKLESYEVGDGFLIKDTDSKISKDSTVVSKTIFPDLHIDPKTSQAFYDMPGFSDTRSAAIDIANAWFVNQVTRHAQRVKIIFVVNHSSLRHGESRIDIKKLLQHAVELLKSPSKFKSSIGLLVSKVRPRKSQTSARIISGVAGFLEGVRGDVAQIFETEEDQERARVLIDAFLTKNSKNEYVRIAYFHQPDDPGLLSEIPEVMAMRDKMLDVVYRQLKFQQKSDEDFGVSISDAAKYLTAKIADAMNQKISEIMSSIGSKIKTNLLEQIQNVPSSSLGALYELSKILEKIPGALLTPPTRQDFIQKLQELIAPLKQPALSVDLNQMQDRDKNLQFFELVRGQSFPPKQAEWILALKEAADAVNLHLNQKAILFNDDVQTRASRLGQSLQQSLRAKVQQSTNEIRKQTVTGELEGLIHKVDHFLAQSAGARTYNEFATKLRTFLSSFGADQSPDLSFPDLTVDLSLDSTALSAHFKLLAWLKPFEKLLDLIGQEKLRIQTEIQAEEHRKQVEAMNEGMSAMKQNFTDQFQAEQKKIESLKNVSESQRQELLRKLDDSKKSHEDELQKIQAAQQAEVDRISASMKEAEALLQKEIAEQKRKTEEMARKFEEERLAQVAREKELREEAEQRAREAAEVAKRQREEMQKMFERQQEENARRDKQRRIQAWENGGRCCRPNNGRCLDGSKGTPCCGRSSCGWFLGDWCCSCGSTCHGM